MVEDLIGKTGDPLADNLTKYGLWIARSAKESFDKARQAGITIPRLTPDALKAIEPRLQPILGQDSQRLASKAQELASANLVRRLARPLENLGPNFITGSGFASYVFNALKDQGIEFPPIEQSTVATYEASYDQKLAEFAQENHLPGGTAEIVFSRFLALAGFLHADFYREKDPNLIKLFEDFGKSRGFATEGAILIYDLKIRQLSIKS